MPPEQVLNIGIQLTDSLVEAHRHGVVHRDLKPGNVCLTPEGRVKVLDCGLAKMRPVQHTEVPSDPASLYPPLSQAGQIFGTPGYTAPEQLLGKTVDNRSDLYSLGMLLFELCTGRRPFEASEPLRTALASLTELTPLAAEVEPTVPADLSAIIGRAMAKEPALRYQSVESMRSDLRNVAIVHNERPTRSISSVGRHSRPPWGPGIAAKWFPHRRAFVGVAAGVLLATLAWLVSRPGPENRRAGPGATAVPVVAVLPFANLGSNPSDDPLGVGIADMLISALDGTPAVSVVSGSATLGHQVSEPDPRMVTRSLGATFVIHGSFEHVTDRLRLTAKLVGADASLAWAGNYEDRLDKVFDVQRRLVEDVYTGLGISLAPADHRRFARAPTQSVEAFSTYVQGRTLLERQDRPRDDITRAIGLFERAIADDTDFALAHAGLGDAYWAQFQETKEPDWAVSATDSVLQALALDPDLPQARLSLATIYQGTGRIELSEDQLRLIIEE